MPRNLFLAAVLAVAGGCPARDVSQPDITAAIEEKSDIPVAGNRDIDILFVIDNSSSMSDKQATLAANFPKFIDVLNTIQGGKPSMHIGVVTSDVGTYPFNGSRANCFDDQGILQSSSPVLGKCPLDPGARFISDIAIDPKDPNGARRQNYTGSLADVFKCIASQGTGGCDFEQHLESMRLALDHCDQGCAQTANEGFLRPGAYLAIVILADEDDCSARATDLFDPDVTKDTVTSIYGKYRSYRCTEFGVLCDGAPIPRTVQADYASCVPRGDSYLYNPDAYVEFLKTLKGDANLVIVSVIAGPPTPPSGGLSVHLVADTDNPTGPLVPELGHSCEFTATNGDHEVADPAIRLAYFARQFGTRSTFQTICNDDLSDALTRIAELLRRVVGTPCLDGNLDTTDVDPGMPGTQLDCQVSDVTFPGGDNSTETVLPRCRMLDDSTPDRSQLPCWWSGVDATACPDTQTHVALKVERSDADVAPGTHELARCRHK